MLACILLCALVAVSCTLPAFAVHTDSSAPNSLQAFDPSAYTLHMPTAERAWRAENAPGGEISYCCCYCGRGLETPAQREALQRDAWLYAPLHRQPRPEKGDPTDRIMRRNKRRAAKRRTPENDGEESSTDSGVAEWIFFRTVESRCNNEFCITHSQTCFRAHLWTGWAGTLTTPDQTAPDSVVLSRCEESYQRQMEVLADLARRTGTG